MTIRLKQNELTSSLTHFVGMLLAIAGLVVLVVYAALQSSVWHITTFSIFGASLVLLYFVSSLYHFVSRENRFKNSLQKIDHAMIFILIAGTYTPVALIPLRGAWGWSLFGIIWGLAVIGILLKIFLSDKLPRWIFSVLYLLMGWLAVVALSPLAHALPAMGLFWLILGGIFYTTGVVFFALERSVSSAHYFGMHEIFHLFVIAGSASHFWLMYKYILTIE